MALFVSIQNFFGSHGYESDKSLSLVEIKIREMRKYRKWSNQFYQLVKKICKKNLTAIVPWTEYWQIQKLSHRLIPRAF